MKFRYTPEENNADFDDLVWEKYMEVYPHAFNGEYKDFIKKNVPGVLHVNTYGVGSIIEYIDFHSEQYYTMFLLRWT